MLGDYLQLPPVKPGSDARAKKTFKRYTWRSLEPLYITLTEVFTQTGPEVTVGALAGPVQRQGACHAQVSPIYNSDKNIKRIYLIMPRAMVDLHTANN